MLFNFSFLVFYLSET